MGVGSAGHETPPLPYFPLGAPEPPHLIEVGPRHSAAPAESFQIKPWEPHYSDSSDVITRRGAQVTPIRRMVVGTPGGLTFFGGRGLCGTFLASAPSFGAKPGSQEAGLRENTPHIGSYLPQEYGN